MYMYLQIIVTFKLLQTEKSQLSSEMLLYVKKIHSYNLKSTGPLHNDCSIMIVTHRN